VTQNDVQVSNGINRRGGKRDKKKAVRGKERKKKNTSKGEKLMGI